jgi:hypothetical protein
VQRIPEVFLVDLCAVFLFLFSCSKLRHSNHRIGAHTCTNQTVPYGTALLGGAVPGTSCQATIAPSLRDAFSPAPLGHNPKSLSFRRKKRFIDPDEVLKMSKLQLSGASCTSARDIRLNLPESGNLPENELG